MGDAWGWGGRRGAGWGGGQGGIPRAYVRVMLSELGGSTPHTLTLQGAGFLVFLWKALTYQALSPQYLSCSPQLYPHYCNLAERYWGIGERRKKLKSGTGVRGVRGSRIKVRARGQV